MSPTARLVVTKEYASLITKVAALDAIVPMATSANPAVRYMQLLSNLLFKNAKPKHSMLERSSSECRKTKAKVIILTNHNRRNLSAMNQQDSKQILATSVQRDKTRASKSRVVLQSRASNRTWPCTRQSFSLVFGKFVTSV